MTETMDCGLLGEHLVQTLLHAWDTLLRPACSQPQLLAAIDSETPLQDFGLVIPFGAIMWAAPLRCPTLAQRYYLLHTDPWGFGNVWLYSDSNEPYDTENLRNIRDCKFLSEAVKVLTFDFNSPSQLKRFYDGLNDSVCFSFEFDGKSDALAVWFDILLDEDIVISTSPFKAHEQCSWDQALFQFNKPQKSFKVKAICKEAKLNFEILPNSTEGDQTKLNVEIGVSVEVIRYINNNELQNVLYLLPEQFMKVTNVLDLSPFPTLGLRFLQLNNVNLVCVLKSEKEVLAVKEIMKANNILSEKIRFVKRNEIEDFFFKNCDKFDFIMNNVFEATGELSEVNISNIPKLRLVFNFK